MKAAKSILLVLVLIALFAVGFRWAFACGFDEGGRQKEAELQVCNIIVSRKDPVGDLQRFYNEQGERYSCGEPDSVPGPLFRQASENWHIDQCAKPYFEVKK